MKLFEITEPLEVDSALEQAKEVIGSVIDIVKFKKLGSGAFAIVYGNPDEPQTVKKVSKGMSLGSVKNDGYLRYVGQIAKYKDRTGNPYLPKIYNIKFYNVSNEKEWDQVKYVIEMEKLEPLVLPYKEDDEHYYDSDEQSFMKQLIAMGKRMFHNFESDDWQTAYDVVDSIVGTVSRLLVNDDPSFRIKDRKLGEALVLIRKAVRGTTRFPDIQDHNFMLRRSKFGLQLVLTDPVA